MSALQRSLTFVLVCALVTATAQAQQWSSTRAASKAVQDYDWTKNTYCNPPPGGVTKGECLCQAKKNFVRACYDKPDFGLGSSCSEIEPDFQVCWKRASDTLNALTAEGTAIVGGMAQIPVQPASETVGQEVAQQVGTAVGEVATGGQVDDQPSTLTRCARAIGNFFKGCFGGGKATASPVASPSATPDKRTPEQKKAEEEYTKRVKARLGIKTAGLDDPSEGLYTPAPVSILRFQGASGSPSPSCTQQTLEAAPTLCPTVSVNKLERVVVDAVMSASAKPPITPKVNPISACVQQCSPVFEKSLKAGKSLADAGADASACASKVCPVIDVDKLTSGLSPKAATVTDKYVACVKAGGSDACRRDLLIGLAGTPEAKTYRFEPVTFEIDEDDFTKAAIGEFGFKDLGAGLGFSLRKFSFNAQPDGLKSPAFETPTISVPLGAANPEVGDGSVKVESVLNDISTSSITGVAKSLATGGVVSVTPYRDPDAAKNLNEWGPLSFGGFYYDVPSPSPSPTPTWSPDSFGGFYYDTPPPSSPTPPPSAVKVKDVAFSVAVKVNPAVQPKNSLLTFAVDKSWVTKNGGPKNIIAIRQPDSGPPQALPANFLGYAVGTGAPTFTVSASGFSVFSLAAVEPAAAPPAKSPGFEAVFGLAALGAALVFFRLRTR